MKTTRQKLIAITLLGLAANLVQANCAPHVFDKQPRVPDGAKTSQARMISAGEEIQRYINSVESDLKCVRNEFSYNLSVKRITELANRYNTELARHRSTVANR